MSDYGIITYDSVGKVNLDPSFNNIRILGDKTFTTNQRWSVTSPLFVTQKIFFFLIGVGQFGQYVVINNKYAVNTYKVVGEIFEVSIVTTSIGPVRVLVGVYNNE